MCRLLKLCHLRRDVSPGARSFHHAKGVMGSWVLLMVELKISDRC